MQKCKILITKLRLICLGFALSISFTPFNAHSQQQGGWVIDGVTSIPIQDAVVQLDEVNIPIHTDSQGHFSITGLPKIVTHIKVSKSGYDELYATIDLRVSRSDTFFLLPNHLQLKEVVISSSFGWHQSENIVPIEEAKISDLYISQPNTLTEAITQLPGVSQISTGVGIGKPVLRGLSGNRVVTYAQNIRMENQQWGDEHGLGVGDIGIENVEVIKGPATLLYGSDALAGVLYFIDERYASPHHDIIKVGSSFQTNNLNFNEQLGWKSNWGKVKLNVFGEYNQAADYTVSSGLRVYNSRFNSSNIKTSLGYSSGNWISNLRMSYLHNGLGIIEDSTKWIQSSNYKLTLPYQTEKNSAISFQNLFFVRKSKLELILGFMDNHRSEFEDNRDSAATDLLLSTYTYNFKWYSPTWADHLKILGGIQGMYQLNKNKEYPSIIPNNRTMDQGAFIMMDYSRNSLKVQSGFRLDSRAIHVPLQLSDTTVLFPNLNRWFHSFNYSLGANFHNEKWNLSANLSTGYRAPNFVELLANGIHEGTNQYIIGDSNLSSEQSSQLDINVNFRSDHLDFFINPFINIIRDFIYLTNTDSTIQQTPVYHYVQNNATLYGGEAEFHWHPHRWHRLHLESNLSMVIGEDNDRMPLPWMPATRISGKAKMEVSQHKKNPFEYFFLEYIQNLPQNKVAANEDKSPAYGLTNLGCVGTVSSKNTQLEFQLGIKNVFNINYVDHLSRLKNMGISGQGINFYCGINISFSSEKGE